MYNDNWLIQKIGLSPDFFDQVTQGPFRGHFSCVCSDASCDCHPSSLTFDAAISLQTITMLEWCVGGFSFPAPPGAPWWQRIYWRWAGPEAMRQRTGLLDNLVGGLLSKTLFQHSPLQKMPPGLGIENQFLQKLATQVNYGVSIGPLSGTSAHDYLRTLTKRLCTDIRELLGSTVKPPFPWNEDGNWDKVRESVVALASSQQNRADVENGIREIMANHFIRCKVKKSQVGRIRSILKYYFPRDAAERMRLSSLLESEHQILKQLLSSDAQPSPWTELVTRQLADLVRLIERMKPTPSSPGDSEGKALAGGGGNVTADEANKTAMELAKKDPAFVNGGAREWAAAIRKATGKTCSTDTVQGTPLWIATMKTTGRGRTKGKTPVAVGLTDSLEATVNGGEPTPFHHAAEIDEAEKAIEQSGMDDNGRQATLDKLRGQRMTPQEAKQLAAEFPPKSPKSVKPFRKL